MLKAIETRYRGYRFRSRTEARWAVFLDALCEPWEYEKQGYALSDGSAYLVDFFLPRQDCYLEIKGAKPTEREIERASLLAQGNDVAVVLFHGCPLDQVGTYFNFSMRSEVVLTYLHFPKQLSFSLSADKARQWRFPELQQAAYQARSARFEFGETPLFAPAAA